MGLTIHYTLTAPHVKNLDEARTLVSQLHDFAATLDFQKLSDIQFIDDFADPMLATFLGCLRPYTKDDGEESFLQVTPIHVLMFVAEQEGSEPALFGLGLFSDTGTDVHYESITRPSGVGNVYRLQRFCKTQFASLSTNGGWGNFLKIHDGICQILDCARSLGVDLDVRDESKYFTKRDPAALRKEIDRWNQLIAAFTGRLKDHLRPGAVVAAITDAPEFEQLEAQGQQLLGDFNPADLDLDLEL